MEQSSTALIASLGRLAGALKIEVEALKAQFDGLEITAKLEEHLRIFDDRYSDFVNLEKTTQNYDAIANSATGIAIFGTAIANSAKEIASDNPELSRIRAEVAERAAILKKNIEDRKIVYRRNHRAQLIPADNTGVSYQDTNSNDHIVQRTVETNVSELADIVVQCRDAISELDIKSSHLHEKTEQAIGDLNFVSQELTQIRERVDATLRDVKATLEETSTELESKKLIVDGLVGTIAEGVIAGDYKNSAADEKRNADVLRVGSLICMAVIALMVGYSFYETTLDSFKWQNSVLRLIFSALLSIPAAYLARESAKHRAQQYSHLQISLDLRAIDPYLASLPENERHRLKAEMAYKLFGAKDSSPLSGDSYPLNTQEILMTLIDKLSTMAKIKEEK